MHGECESREGSDRPGRPRQQGSRDGCGLTSPGRSGERRRRCRRRLRRPSPVGRCPPPAETSSCPPAHNNTRVTTNGCNKRVATTDELAQRKPSVGACLQYVHRNKDVLREEAGVLLLLRPRFAPVEQVTRREVRRRRRDSHGKVPAVAQGIFLAKKRKRRRQRNEATARQYVTAPS